MRLTKILLFLFTLVIIGCFPEPPDYVRELDETTLAVSGGFRQGDTTHYIYLESLYECSDYTPGECGDLSYHGNGIDSAFVQITIGDSIYIGKQTGQYYFKYEFDFLINPGDTIDLFASHKDFESAWASIVVPNDVTVNQLNEIENENSILDYTWSESENAVGFDSHLYLIGKNDSSEYRYQLYDSYEVEKDEGWIVSWDEKPNKRKSYSKILGDAIEQITAFRFDTNEIINNSDSLFLQLDVWLLDEAYYNTMLSRYSTEEYSGFSAPLTQYSNIENGVGVICAYWISRSELIDVTGYLK